MKTQTEKIKKFLNNLDTEIDILDYINPEKVKGYGDILAQIDKAGGFDVHVADAVTAISYLQVNDSNLTKSLLLALKAGYRFDKVNSEILATLLLSQRAKDRFAKLEPEITEFFDNLK